jgi:hypothetical protein
LTQPGTREGPLVRLQHVVAEEHAGRPLRVGEAAGSLLGAECDGPPRAGSIEAVEVPEVRKSLPVVIDEGISPVEDEDA